MLEPLDVEPVTFAIIAIVASHMIGMIGSLHAVMYSRTPQGAIAWSFSLVIFPYFTLPVYLVFGRRKFQGYVHARKQDLANITGLLEQCRTEALLKGKAQEVLEETLRGAERLARVPGTGGNEVDLLIDGEATFDSILTGINLAEKHILVQFYIVRNDELGLRVQKCLIDAAQRGLEVYFLYDEIGSISLPGGYLKQLEIAGIRVSSFNSSKGYLNRAQLNFRNHRKIVVVDGVVSWIGGHNIGDEYLGKDPDLGDWRDTHIRIEGPATMAVQLSFVEDWRWASGDTLEHLNWIPGMHQTGSKGVLIVPSGPADVLETTNLMFLHVINNAKLRLWITSPYFVPDSGIIAALQLAALRGVDVRIMVPEKPDQKMVGLATYAYFDDVNVAGVKVYRYEAGFLHQKVVLVDDDISVIGTANFDNRSFRLNFEISALITDRTFNTEVRLMLESDFECCCLMQNDAYISKGLLFRLGARMSRLAAPIL